VEGEPLVRQGRCACRGARCEGEVRGRLRLAQRGSESGDNGGRTRLGMGSEGRGDKQRAVGALMLSYGGDVEDGLALHYRRPDGASAGATGMLRYPAS
jgi:hypothetical protein